MYRVLPQSWCRRMILSRLVSPTESGLSYILPLVYAPQKYHIISRIIIMTFLVGDMPVDIANFIGASISHPEALIMTSNTGPCRV
jgi:hypothetical protein